MEKLEKLLQEWDLKPRPLVGISISSSEIIMLQLVKVEGVHQIESYAKLSIPPGLIVENEIKDIPKLAAILKSGLEEAHIDTQYAAVALPSATAITKFIDFPIDYSEQDIIEEIEIDAQKYIPYDFEEVDFDYNLLGPYKENSKLQTVLLAATKKEYINQYVEAVTIAGLKVDVVDVEALADNRCFEIIFSKLPQTKNARKIATVTIGQNNLQLNIYHNTNQIFTRELEFGCEYLTNEIQQRYGLDYTEAQLVKTMDYLPEDYKDEVLNPFVLELTQHIYRTLQFFYSSEDDEEVDYIVLSGIGAVLPDLVEQVQEATNAKTLLANPFAQMLVSSKVNAVQLQEDAPCTITAFGLALRGVV